jgi:hypothetical protein
MRGNKRNKGEMKGNKGEIKTTKEIKRELREQKIMVVNKERKK